MIYQIDVVTPTERYSEFIHNGDSVTVKETTELIFGEMILKFPEMAIRVYIKDDEGLHYWGGIHSFGDRKYRDRNSSD